MSTRLQEFSRILLVGDSCIDVYHEGVCQRINPEAPTVILKKLSERSQMGMSSNVRENLKSAGVVVDHITHEEIIIKNRYVDISFNQQLLRVDEGEAKKVKPLDVSSLKDNYDIVIISDYNKGFLTEEVCKDMCDKYCNSKIYVDSKKSDLSCFSNSTIKINKKEFESAKNISRDNDIIVTLGKDGAMFDGKKFEAENVNVFDVSGAGDVFLSSMVIGHIIGLDVHKSIEFSVKSSTLSVTKMGTYVMKEKDWESCYEKVCV